MHAVTLEATIGFFKNRGNVLPLTLTRSSYSVFRAEELLLFFHTYYARLSECIVVSGIIKVANAIPSMRKSEKLLVGDGERKIQFSFKQHSARKKAVKIP